MNIKRTKEKTMGTRYYYVVYNIRHKKYYEFICDTSKTISILQEVTLWTINPKLQWI